MKKKLMALGLAAAFVLSTPLAALAWVHKELKVGLTIEVNDTFKITQNSGKEATLEGTIYKNPTMIYMSRDDSMDWSELSDKEILKALTTGSRHAFAGFKVVDEGKGGIGEQPGRYATFDAKIKGKAMHGYLQFAVAEGELYSVIMLYGVGGEKTDEVASQIVGSTDFAQ